MIQSVIFPFDWKKSSLSGILYMYITSERRIQCPSSLDVAVKYRYSRMGELYIFYITCMYCFFNLVLATPKTSRMYYSRSLVVSGMQNLFSCEYVNSMKYNL